MTKTFKDMKCNKCYYQMENCKTCEKKRKVNNYGYCAKCAKEYIKRKELNEYIERMNKQYETKVPKLQLTKTT